MARSATQEVKAEGTHREKQDLGHVTLLGPVGGVLVNLKHKRGVFVSPLGILSKGCKGITDPGKQGRLLNTRAAGKVIS